MLKPDTLIVPEPMRATMRRRDFLDLCGGLAVLRPQNVVAQLAKGKIGYLHPVTISPSHITFSILQREWQRLGYIERQTLLARSGEGDLRRLPGLVRELVDKEVGVLIVVGADAVRAAAKTTLTPIVAIDMETDPVQTGLIAGFSRPGGNVTGLFLDMPSLATKWIELMREIISTALYLHGNARRAEASLMSRLLLPKPCALRRLS